MPSLTTVEGQNWVTSSRRTQLFTCQRRRIRVWASNPSRAVLPAAFRRAAEHHTDAFFIVKAGSTARQKFFPGSFKATEATRNSLLIRSFERFKSEGRLEQIIAHSSSRASKKTQVG